MFQTRCLPLTALYLGPFPLLSALLTLNWTSKAIQ